jgi:hypothetical protein
LSSKATNLKAIKSIVGDIVTSAERLDKHKAEKLTAANAFVDLLYTQMAIVLAGNSAVPYLPNEVNKEINKLLVALDLSKNQKFIKKLHKFLRYLEADHKLDPLLAKHKLQQIMESLHIHLDVNMNKIGDVMLMDAQELLKWARAMVGFLDASKKELLRGAPKESAAKPEVESD